MKSNPAPIPPRPKHRLLSRSRQWHKWGGLTAGAFLLLVAASGIVLNYKQPILTALGLEREPMEAKIKREKSATAAPLPKLTTTTGLSAASVPLETALALARKQWGDAPLERIELKDERGTLLYKIKARDGEELSVNALTGAHFLKGEYEKITRSGTGDLLARRTDWGKILLDLHTGKIGGAVGKAIMTAAAGLLLLLTLSGSYLWLKPLLIRCQNARAKAAMAQAGPVLPPLPRAANRRQSFASRR